ncbi:hypothetical protein V865_005466 [Kwoniella europaea PYCC6329]|uniref:F-box domain-containing protein n=1 Tax=Kwoniella europaea PYCC6329 TaxID=1423913 RepID=A0AAX4KNT6_9TREE
MTTLTDLNPSPSTSPLDLDRFPSDIIYHLFHTIDDLPPSTLYSLVQCSWEMHDRFAPVLNRSIDLKKTNSRSVFSGLDKTDGQSDGPQHRRKADLLGQAQYLSINDLPSAEYLSQALTLYHRISPTSPTSPNPYFPNLTQSLFQSLHTLALSSKAIMGLADLYNSCSWGSSPFNIPSQPILRSLKYHLKPKEVILDYPQGMIGLHMHSCIEEVISYISQGWDLDTLTWTNLNRSMVGPVPKSRKLVYQFRECTHPTKCSPSLKGCPEHYDHVSLSCSTFIDHIHTLPFSSPDEAQKGVRLELEGLGCMFSLEWERVVEEVWSRMGRVEEGDWEKIDRWYRAKVSLTA